MIVVLKTTSWDPVMQCTTLPSHSGFSQQKLVSFVTEINKLSNLTSSLRIVDIDRWQTAPARVLKPMQLSSPRAKEINLKISLGHIPFQTLVEHHQKAQRFKDKGTSANSEFKAFQDNAKVWSIIGQRTQDRKMAKDDKDNDKGSKSRSQSMKEQAYNI
ncbi:hypothetical protein Tco_0032532 [Tanacetum coccineum]